MILSLRKKHRIIFIVLGMALPIVFIGGIAARKPPAWLPVLAKPADTKNADYPVTEWDRSDLFTNGAIKVRLLGDRADTNRSALAFTAAADFIKPDLMVYWVTGNLPSGKKLPENAVLIGQFRQESVLPIPRNIIGENGSLALYSLADQSVVGISKTMNFKKP